MNTIRTRLVRLGTACALTVSAVVGAIGPASSGADTPVPPVMHLSVNSSKVMDIPGESHAPALR